VFVVTLIRFGKINLIVFFSWSENSTPHRTYHGDSNRLCGPGRCLLCRAILHQDEYTEDKGTTRSTGCAHIWESLQDGELPCTSSWKLGQIGGPGIPSSTRGQSELKCQMASLVRC
jgi:hypothetical protein